MRRFPNIPAALAVTLALSALVTLHPAAVVADTGEPSPYAEWKGRPIAALSPDEIAGYLAGKGMGFALPAELNSYPGPKHVLELADRLGLDERQQAETLAAFERMEVESKDLGAIYVGLEAELDALFRERRADDAAVLALVLRIGEVRARLRNAHLQAHLAMVRLLAPAQIARYDELRGYKPRPSGSVEPPPSATPGAP